MNRATFPCPFDSAPSPWRKALVVFLVLLGICSWAMRANATVPPRPADREFFHDLAGVIHADDAQKIRDLQQEVFRQSGVPIVVVTVSRMDNYLPDSTGIESFARRWFDSWGIGSQAKNDGMLVLVSTGDRKARIELGAAWERRFDEFSKRLMDRKMVPEFKNANYGGGVLAAVQSLAEIAKAGSKASPPDQSLTDRILNHPIMVFSREENPISKKGGSLAVVLVAIVGLGCLLAAIGLPEYRKRLVILGLVLVGIAIFFWIVAAILLMWGWVTGKVQIRGGGGFGGGSSGGGGASGGW